MARVVVVGGGIAGLTTALFGARRGHEMVLVDRDPGPPDSWQGEEGRWRRRGVAQAWFAHFFIARSTRVIRMEAPDLLPLLAKAGVGTADLSFGPGYEQDTALAARRPVYEAVLRRFVRTQPGVAFRHGSVQGLLVDGRIPAKVTGVRLDRGHEIRADLVVDAGGRRSSTGRWLREAGLPGPAVEEESCRCYYYCLHYRLRDGESFPAGRPQMQRLPYGATFIFPGDDRTFSIAWQLSATDPLRQAPRHPEVFDRMVGAVPLSAAWRDRAEPLGELRVMAGLSNRRRRLVVRGRPLVAGLALVGDSCMYTNPTLGQGVSLSFWMAQRLAAAIGHFRRDPAAAAVAYERWVDEEMGPHFDRQLRADRNAIRQLEAGVRGEGYLPPADDRSRYLAALAALGAEDDTVSQLITRVGHLLDRPAAYCDPALRKRVQERLDGDQPPGGGEGPLPRMAFESLVTA